MYVKSGLAVASLVLGLSACATTDDRTMHTAPQKAPSLMDNDEAYVAYVERVARRRGIEVMWVNTPRKRSVASAQSE